MGYQSVVKDNLLATFAETDIYITNGLALKAGARYEYSSVIKKSNIAPRLSLAYKNQSACTGFHRIWNLYQKPENRELIVTNNLGYTKATHYIANYQKTNNDRIFRIEALLQKV